MLLIFRLQVNGNGKSYDNINDNDKGKGNDLSGCVTPL